jgi:hypothetical protein
MFILNNKILKSRIEWKNHVQRTQDRRIPSESLTHNPKIGRNIGRPELIQLEQRTLQEDGTDTHGLIHDEQEEEGGGGGDDDDDGKQRSSIACPPPIFLNRISMQSKLTFNQNSAPRFVTYKSTGEVIYGAI